MTDHTHSNDDSDRINFDPNDPLVMAWADQGEPENAVSLPTDPDALADSVAKAHRKDQRRLFWLFGRELLVVPVIVFGFGTAVPEANYPAAIVIAIALVLGLGFFMVVNAVRHYRADRNWDTSLRDQLDRRLAQLNHRAWLYRNVGWWYFLPLILAIVLVLFGVGAEFEPFMVFFAVGFAIFTVVMYLINRWIGRTVYEAEADRIGLILADFDRPS